MAWHNRTWTYVIRNITSDCYLNSGVIGLLLNIPIRIMYNSHPSLPPSLPPISRRRQSGRGRHLTLRSVASPVMMINSLHDRDWRQTQEISPVQLGSSVTPDHPDCASSSAQVGATERGCATRSFPHSVLIKSCSRKRNPDQIVILAPSGANFRSL